MKAVTVIVRGEVQGVSFRAYCARRARELGVRGHVHNEPDGSVSAHFEGAEDAVDQMVQWCREGSPSASVDAVFADVVDPEGHDEFSIT